MKRIGYRFKEAINEGWKRFTNSKTTPKTEKKEKKKFPLDCNLADQWTKYYLVEVITENGKCPISSSSKSSKKKKTKWTYQLHSPHPLYAHEIKNLIPSHQSSHMADIAHRHLRINGTNFFPIPEEDWEYFLEWTEDPFQFQVDVFRKRQVEGEKIVGRTIKLSRYFWKVETLWSWRHFLHKYDIPSVETTKLLHEPTYESVKGIKLYEFTHQKKTYYLAVRTKNMYEYVQGKSVLCLGRVNYQPK